jgi:hypothetical protein
MSTPTSVTQTYLNAFADASPSTISVVVESAAVSLRRRCLTPFQARRIKRNLVIAFCEGRISQAAVDRAFEMFPELRRA